MLQHNQNSIKIVGVGSGGNNILEYLIKSNSYEADFIAANTNPRVLEMSSAPTKILLKLDLLDGVDADKSPLMNYVPAKSIRDITNSIEGAATLYLITGMGGMTGANGCQIFAEIAQILGIHTIAIVTQPFSLEGQYRMGKAEDGIARIGNLVNSVVVMPNDQICNPVGRGVLDSFKAGDAIISGAVRGITNHISH
jgi:cell division protein FtsZ